ncbi:DNA topology modulation protein [Virgibacillus sp. C22-A2]|uniref:DNA topology modulation protein n=1 Tax=Virgibacillus tibetensis TaxID=3042313 RepID=A0ABU6KEP2_9BACI|nr:DNA topology modulation protein [Virgibacillus sp. C22-A2]
MKKIAIIGSGGAGKSTLAQRLGSILDIPVYHLDAIHWKPGWKAISRAELIEETEKILQHDAWIIDGNYGGTMDIRLQQADTVLFLHYPTIYCLYGITKRRIQYRNQTRPDMGEGCPEKLDWEFINWVRQFNKTKVPAIYDRLSNLDDTTIHIFKSRKKLNLFLNQLEEKVQQLS